MTMPDGSTNINTAGGDFAGRDIDKRQGTFNTYTEDTRYDVRGLAAPTLACAATATPSAIALRAAIAAWARLPANSPRAAASAACCSSRASAAAANRRL
jgi:hypothetical protein